MAADEAMREAAQNELAWRACSNKKTGLLYFAQNYCYLWSKEGGDPLKLDLWECQEDALRQFSNERLLIILKTRQLGMSWMCCVYALWKMIFTANMHVYFQSLGQREVAEQIERIKFIYSMLPRWMQERVELGGKGRKDNDSLSELSNGSALHAVSTTKRAGHGAAPGLYILDEYARNEQAIQTWRAVKPALAARGQVIIVSTANGWGNRYEEIWHAAASGTNSFHPVFYPAGAHPDYTPDFLAREKLDYAGDLVGYYEAYPSTPEEAFLTSTRCPFDQERIASAQHWVRDNKIEPRIGNIICDVEGRWSFEDDETGSFQLWREPVPGHHYCQGADVAEGLTRGDYSAAVVFDTDSHEVVCLYRSKVKPEFYSVPLLAMAHYYNDAWLAVEVNKGSELIMDDLKAQYPYLYRREQKANYYDVPTMVPGFYTSATSKPRIITQLRRYFGHSENPLKIYSKTILNEMSTFEEKGDKLQASGNNHDDTVMALAIAIEAQKSMPYVDEADYIPPHRRFGSRSL